MITLNTILYEGNFRNYLNEDCWFFSFKSKYITKKRITINNLSSIDEFNSIVDKLKLNHDFEIVFVSDYEKEAIDYFKLNMNNESVGYVYSIPYFVDILTITTPFIFNVSSDCCSDIQVNDDYFEKSIDILNQDNKYPITTLSWGESWVKTGVPSTVPPHITCVGEWEQVNGPSYNDSMSNEFFWCSEVFSDQVFIGHIDKLKNIDYNLPPMGRYNGPEYGGTNAFEARLSEYLANNNLFRLIFKSEDLYYKHIG